jgi:tRNA(Ile)-lysidine synthase
VFSIKKFIRENGLIECGDTVLVAVSGGIDSMALATILLAIKDELGFSVGIMHVNHGLRGEESDGDEGLVRDFARRHDVPCYVSRWKAPSKENLQEAAREFRFSEFIKVAREVKASRVAVAHNLDDQAETVLYNMIRGTGLDGLCGMRLVSRRGGIYFIRPLLYTARSEIEGFVKALGVPYRVDSSNLGDKYTRNVIRHEVLPAIKRLNPSFLKGIVRMTTSLCEDEETLMKAARRLMKRYIISSSPERVEIDRSVTHYPVSIRRRIFKLGYISVNGGTEKGLLWDHLLRIDEISRSGAGSVYHLPHGISFEHNKKDGVLAFYKE